ncbi:MAG: hypothetical protein ACJA0H_001265 [Francisellaceae bacterium]|jgi:hypothetical protein
MILNDINRFVVKVCDENKFTRKIEKVFEGNANYSVFSEQVLIKSRQTELLVVKENWKDLIIKLT